MTDFAALTRANIHELVPIGSAKLPQVYEAAVSALAKCERIDECQAWANKSEALASYAKQSHDDSLRKMADRIQARAIRRCGELLRQVPKQSGPVKMGALQKPSRSEVAAGAGLSTHQAKTALQVASVPAESFHQQVESDTPPTVTQLADQGKQQRKSAIDLGQIDPKDFELATRVSGELRRLAEMVQPVSPDQVVRGMFVYERQATARRVASLLAWLNRFAPLLEEDK